MKILKSEISKIFKVMSGIKAPNGMATQDGILLHDNYLVVNNFETAIKADLGFSTGEKFVIPTRAIEIIDTLPEEEIEIKGTDKTVTVKSSCGTNRFATIDPELFQSVTDETSENTMQIGAEFSENVSKILSCCDENSLRPAMQGILLNSDGHELEIVACDGFRCAVSRMNYGTEFRAIIPKIAIQRIINIAGKTVTISILKNKAVFKADNYTIYTSLLSGDFIDYKKIFPVEYNGVFEIAKSPLLKTLDRAEKMRLIGIKITACEDYINISRKSDLAELDENIEVDTIEFSEIEIGINPKFLKSVIQSIDDKAKIFYTTPNSPVVIEDDTTTKYLILPMRLREGQ